jgi:hypothetical protein
MNNKRNFFGLTSLVIIVLSLFIIIFASLEYLNCNSYKQRSVRRVEITLLQYELENEMVNEIFEMKEFYYENNIEKTIQRFNLVQISDNIYQGVIQKQDYKINYEVETAKKLNLLNYYIINTDNQVYSEKPFDD